MQPCSETGCSNPAAPSSEKCFLHVADIDEWLETALAKTAPELSAMLLELYPYYVLNREPVASELEKLYTQDRDPTGKVAFSFASIILWMITAAGTGIVGNWSYDKMKSLISSYREKRNQELGEGQAPLALLPEVVPEYRYEDIRRRIHGTEVTMDPDEDVLEILEYRYTRIVLRSTEPSDRRDL